MKILLERELSKYARCLRESFYPLHFYSFAWQDKPEAPQNKTTDIKNKKDEIADPFEYVRNMGTGASMEPIRSKTASTLTSQSSHSDPLILWKNSQIQTLATLAKKKSTIPGTACEAQ